MTVAYASYLGGGSYDIGYGIALDAVGSAYVTGYTQSNDFPIMNAKYPNYGGDLDAFVVKLSGDGQTLSFATFLGGSSQDYGFGIAVDAVGSAYVTGETLSSDFPAVNAKYPNLRGNDAFVVKLGSNGQTVAYATYLGGSGPERGTGIAVDAVGSAYVTGYTLSSDFPTVNAKYPNLAGPSDAFVAKLGSDGQTIAYATYLGGSGGETGAGIAVDSVGNAHVVGFTTSNDFPTVNGKYPNLAGSQDAFVAKLGSDGQTVAYATYLGGSSAQDWGTAIAVDAVGSAYVTGYTLSSDFPTVNAKYPKLGGYFDAFVVKLSNDGQFVAYATYLGGSSEDVGIGIAVDAVGNAYVTGASQSSDFPAVNAVYPDYGGEHDAFVVKFAENCGPTFCNPAIAAQFPKLLDPPQPFIPPALPPPLPDARKRHVVVLVHGWMSEPAAWADETSQQIGDLLAARGVLCKTNPAADPCWDVIPFDWSDWAGGLLALLPQSAYLNAYEVGAFLGYFLDAQYGASLGHVHLVGHSAGAHVVHRTARTLERIKRDTGKGPESLHMTFLDAFTPFPTDVITFGRINNSLIPNFVDSYATDLPPSSTTVDALLTGTTFGATLKLASLYVWTQTATPFLYAYNRGISLLDPESNEFDPFSWAIQNHAWPYQFFQCSIDPANGNFADSTGQTDQPCPTDHGLYGFGFPISMEFNRFNTVQFLRDTWKPGSYCLATSTTQCTNPITLAKQAVEKAVDATIDAAKTGLSVTGKVFITAAAKSYDLTNDFIDFANDYGVNLPLPLRAIGLLDLITGSPAWVRFRVDVPESANTLRFNYRFTGNAEGYLRVFIHDRQIWSANQRFDGTNQTVQAEVALDELGPGNYEIAFRLDTLDGSEAKVSMSDFETVQVSSEDVPNQAPVANAGADRTVRHGSVVALNGSASGDPDNAPSPLTYAWTQTAGPGVALNPANGASPVFTPVVQGTYRFSLTVNDGAAASTPDEVAIVVPRLGDVDLDGDVDNNDLTQITAARNKPAASANDLRDLDGNMKIDALDARRLTTLCTRARCAVQ